MKKCYLLSTLMVAFAAFMFSGCSPVTMTSWHNPKAAADFKVKTMVIWAMVDKLEYEKPFEEAIAEYLSQQGDQGIPRPADPGTAEKI